MKNQLLFVMFGIGVSASAAEPVVRGSLRVTAYDSDCLRIEYSREKKFENLNTLFSRRPAPGGGTPASMTVSNEGNRFVFETPSVRLTYEETGRWPDQKSLWAEVKVPGGWDRYWNYGKRNQWNLGGTKQALDYVGGPVPLTDGLISRDGWYWLEDSHRPLIDSSGWIQKRDPTGIIDGYLFAYGNQYGRAFRCLKTIAGATPIPRKRSLGVWYSRWWKYSESDFRQIVREFEERMVPLDMLVFDMNWHQRGWTGYTWNRQLMPRGEEFIRELDRAGIGITLNDHPQGGISPEEERYADVMRALGRDPSSKSWVEFNAGDRRVMNAIFGHVHGPFLKAGAEFWWLDWMGDNKYEFNRLDWLNHLYFELSRASGQRPQGFSRWSDWGNHRYPIQFSGDTLISWDTLRFLVPFTASSGNVGANYWSHDIGGFIDKNFRVNAVLGWKDPELYIRWAQYSVFTPIFRFHSVNHWHLDKRPWKWGPEAERIVSETTRLRGRLMPTIYAEAERTFQTNLPMVRSMYLMHPNDEEAYRAPDQYYFGERLMVAPILAGKDPATGRMRRRIWFPESERWFNFHSHQEVTGAGWKEVESPLETIPVYVRGGYPILLQSDGKRSAREFKNDLTVRLFPGRVGHSSRTFIYDDDGKSELYQSGGFHRIPLNYRQITAGLHELEIGSELAGFGCRDLKLDLRGFSSGTEAIVFVNGQETFRKRAGSQPFSIRCESATSIRILEGEVSKGSGGPRTDGPR